MNVNGMTARRSRVSGPTRTLGSVARGDAVEVVAILSPALRDLCDDIGLHAGDVVQCRGATDALLLAEVPAGHIVALTRERANAIRVRDVFRPHPHSGPAPLTPALLRAT